MATPITLEAFLRRDYENERECEFVDGFLEERTGGDYPHASLFAELAYWFHSRDEEWGINGAMSYSMWITPTRIRVPDIVVMDDNLREHYRKTPPLLVVEVLAPEDTLLKIFTRCNDFRTMGVRNIWLIDSLDHTCYVYTESGLKLLQTPRFTIPHSPIYLDIAELAAERT